MRTFTFVFAVFFSSAAFAQVADQQATQKPGSGVDVADPAMKARIRVDGAAGGTGARVSPEASGGATVTNGRQNRHPAFEEQPGPDAPPPPPQRAEKK